MLCTDFGLSIVAPSMALQYLSETAERIEFFVVSSSTLYSVFNSCMLLFRVSMIKLARRLCNAMQDSFS